MAFYFLLFVVIGGFMGYANAGMIAIVAISIIWSLAFGAWGIAAFVELIIGYGIGFAIRNAVNGARDD